MTPPYLTHAYVEISYIIVSYTSVPNTIRQHKRRKQLEMWQDQVKSRDAKRRQGKPDWGIKELQLIKEEEKYLGRCPKTIISP